MKVNVNGQVNVSGQFSFTIGLGGYNAGFIEMANKNCPPLQWIREITQNSIDALTISENPKGEVWWFATSYKGVRKIAIADNGKSMDPFEIQEFMGGLGCGDSNKTTKKNMGVGSKIAAMPLNQHGVIYFCKQKNEKAHVTIFKKENGNYIGVSLDLNVFMNEFNNEIPEIITKEGSGTFIIFCGNSEEEDTWNTTNDKKRRVELYLNTRYLKIPENITIWNYPLQEDIKQGTRRQSIKGGNQIRNNYTKANGISKLSKGEVHWWILKDQVKGSGTDTRASHDGGVPLNGCFCIIHEEEIYQCIEGDNGNALKKKYGIARGTERIILDVKVYGTEPSHSRNGLVLKGSPLEFTILAEEFRNSFPKELSKYIKDISDANQKTYGNTRDTKLWNKTINMISILGTNPIQLVSMSVKNSNGSKKVEVKKKKKESEEKNDTVIPKNTGTGTKHKIKDVEINPSSENERNVQRKSYLAEPIFNLRWIPEEEKTLNEVFVEFRCDINNDNFDINLNYPNYQTFTKNVRNYYGYEDVSTFERKCEETIHAFFLETYALAKSEYTSDKIGLEKVLNSDFLTNLFNFQKQTIMEKIVKACTAGGQDL